MQILPAQEVRRLDLRTIQELGIPAELLMDTAGRAIADVITERLGPGSGRSAVVLAGVGNNGGDGLVVARVLAGRGWLVHVLLAGDPAKMTAETQLHHRAALQYPGQQGTLSLEAVTEAPRGQRLSDLQNRLEQSTVIVDALAGTGLQGPLREPLLTLAAQLDGHHRALVVAADIPSGLCATTGQVLGAAVHCDTVVAMAALKPGLLLGQGPQLHRELRVADIGIPPAWLDAAQPRGDLLDAELARSWVTQRQDHGHKGTFGHLLALAGSPGKGGAALLTCGAALRVGTALVTLGVVQQRGTQCQLRDQLEGLLPDVMAEEASPASLPALLLRNSAVLAGPGMGTGAEALQALEQVAARATGPLLFDADALTLLAAQPQLVASAAGRLVLTPHPGEMARLLGLEVSAVEADRLGAAREAAQRWQAVVVLKGHRTLVAAPQGRWAICNQPNAALARGGSGDVLAGAIGGLLAQGMAPFEAAALGVWLHSRAGAALRRQFGSRSGLASELGLLLATAVQELES